MFMDILLVLDEFILKLLFEIGALAACLRQAINCIHHEVKTIQFIQHRHVERSGDGAFLLIAANVDVVMVCAAIRQPVDQPRVGMEGKNNVVCPRVKSASKSTSLNPSADVRSLRLEAQLRSTTLITRIF